MPNPKNHIKQWRNPSAPKGLPFPPFRNASDQPDYFPMHPDLAAPAALIESRLCVQGSSGDLIELSITMSPFVNGTDDADFDDDRSKTLSPDPPAVATASAATAAAAAAAAAAVGPPPPPPLQQHQTAAPETIRRGAYHEIPPPSAEFRWFTPGDGIAPEVITADIPFYLGRDALVRRGYGVGEYEGQFGYWISAYRNLTANMIETLKQDSRNWYRDPRRGQFSNTWTQQDLQHHRPWKRSGRRRDEFRTQERLGNMLF